jgi:hypothetical protein
MNDVAGIIGMTLLLFLLFSVAEWSIEAAAVRWQQGRSQADSNRAAPPWYVQLHRRRQARADRRVRS